MKIYNTMMYFSRKSERVEIKKKKYENLQYYDVF